MPFAESVRTRTKRVQPFALRSLVVGFTHVLPRRFPATPRSSASFTVAGSLSVKRNVIDFVPARILVLESAASVTTGSVVSRGRVAGIVEGGPERVAGA